MPTTEQQRALSEPFPASKIKQVQQRGQSLDYIPVAEVISRMNSVLGTGNWSDTIETIYRDEATDSVIAHVRVTATIDGHTCVADGVGGSDVKRYASGKNQGNAMGLGDDFKSAYSDALKKACQRLGVALHLALGEEEIILEPEVSEEEWDTFIGHFKALDEVSRKAVEERWSVNNKSKPTREKITKAQFAELMGWVVAEETGGTVVTEDEDDDNEPF